MLCPFSPSLSIGPTNLACRRQEIRLRTELPRAFAKQVLPPRVFSFENLPANSSMQHDDFHDLIADGSGKAAGIEIAGGRETRVQNVSMKGVEIGLRIAYGINSGSSDADIRDMSIICNDSATSYGLKLEGSDNSATNIRIGHVAHGVRGYQIFIILC